MEKYLVVLLALSAAITISLLPVVMGQVSTDITPLPTPSKLYVIPVSSAFDGRDGFDALSGAWDLDITTMQGKTYAVVASRIDDAVQIINITNPSDPKPVSSVFNGRGGFDALHFATGVDITTVQGKTYAVVTSRDDDAVQIIDITALPSPKPVSSVFDGQGGFSALDFALDVEIVDISGKTYAVVASRNDDGIQIIDITNPSDPKPVSSAVDGRGGFNALDGSREVDILVMSNMTYAVVAAVNDDAIQIINITIPSNPKPVSSVFDGQGGFDALDGAEDVDTVTISGKTYAVVAALYDDAVQIINIT